MTDLRCLTVRQPHASRIVSGAKTIEHRSWRTSYRGLLLIHAGLDDDEPCPPALALPRGALIGSVVLAGVERGDGCWHWLLTDPREWAEPIPCRGRLWLWPLPAGLPPIPE